LRQVRRRRRDAGAEEAGEKENGAKLQSVHRVFLGAREGAPPTGNRKTAGRGANDAGPRRGLKAPRTPRLARGATHFSDRPRGASTNFGRIVDDAQGTAKRFSHNRSLGAPHKTLPIGGETMDPDLAQRIARNPKYQELKAKRSRFGWILTVLMLIVYYGFIMLVAFDKPFLFQRLGAGVTTIGMPIGFAVIIFTVVITGIYVRRANREFDALSDDVAKEALK
jgi:uncharacterized membrane protein (DUF485 family)